MRVATVFAGVPNPWQSGGPLKHWATLKALRDAGHSVTFVALPWELADGRRAERLAAVRELGVDVASVPRVRDRPPPSGRWRARAAYMRTILWPGDEALFPTSVYSHSLAGVVSELGPDVLLADATPAISAAHGIEGIPKLAMTSDPPGLSRKLRVRYEPQYPWRLGRDELLYRLGSATYVLRADPRFLALLRRYDSVAMFAAHHADWARRGGARAWHAYAPVEDAAGPDWRERRSAAARGARPRILMIGHLRGISTLSGLHVLVENVLPRLTRELGPEGFDLHIVGAYDPPTSLHAALDHPAVRLSGHVEPPDDEFLSADVLLVTTPVETGPRVRIVTGMCFGCCVVAHTANRLGIPELEHERNVLLADSEGLADQTLRALRDAALRQRLGESGRSLYEARFAPETAGARLVRELERLAGAAAREPTGLPA